MSTYGRQSLAATGRPVMVAAGESKDIRWKTGGVTIDWASVVAVAGAAVTLLDDTVVEIGQKFLRFGQILTKIKLTETQVVNNGGATGVNFTLNGSVAIAFNASAATVQAALVTVFGAGLVSVTGSAGGPWTVTFDNSLGDVALMTVVDSTTGGTGVTVSAGTAGGRLGEYGPYDPAAADGRQLRVRGEAYILNQTVLENGLIPGLGGGTSDHPAVLEGGYIWKARVLMTTGSASLANGPTVAEFEALFPDVHYVQS